MNRFIGRQSEMSKLLTIASKKTASFIVIRGRRRIGKSRLVQEFSRHFDKFYRFEGLPPEEGVTASHQLESFARAVAQQFQAPFARYEDWSDALWAVGERVQKGKTLILFDEISWMGIGDPTFLGKIKSFWDNHLKNNGRLVFVICGSASSWIEKNILSSTGFVGRISYTLTLEELSLDDCKKFWHQNISMYEQLKVLAVTGGVPKYLEEIDPRVSAEENIKRLCFTKGAMLVEEFEQIFSDLFLRDSALYKKIIEILATGPHNRRSICAALKIDPGGRISEYLEELELAGFVARDYTWNIKSGVDSKLSQYRLKDNYFRFYLKYIEKNLTKINRDNFLFKSLVDLPEWKTICGLQFENVVLNNRRFIHQALGLSPDEIISENPFYQQKTSRLLGCQIDYMIQTKFGGLFVCEIKFSKNRIDASVIASVQQKIDRLQYPKGYSCRPVLIHVNGVTDEVLERDYFAAIIEIN